MVRRIASLLDAGLATKNDAANFDAVVRRCRNRVDYGCVDAFDMEFASE
jgi:hypothetical protein